MGPLINIFKCAVASLVLAAASPAFAGVVVCLDGPPPGTNGYDDTSGCASAINFYSSVGCEAIHSDDNANGQAVDEFDTLAVSCFNALGEPVDEPPLPPTILPESPSGRPSAPPNDGEESPPEGSVRCDRLEGRLSSRIDTACYGEWWDEDAEYGRTTRLFIYSGDSQCKNTRFIKSIETGSDDLSPDDVHRFATAFSDLGESWDFESQFCVYAEDIRDDGSRGERVLLEPSPAITDQDFECADGTVIDRPLAREIRNVMSDMIPEFSATGLAGGASEEFAFQKSNLCRVLPVVIDNSCSEGPVTFRALLSLVLGFSRFEQPAIQDQFIDDPCLVLGEETPIVEPVLLDDPEGDVAFDLGFEGSVVERPSALPQGLGVNRRTRSIGCDVTVGGIDIRTTNAQGEFGPQNVIQSARNACEQEIRDQASDILTALLDAEFAARDNIRVLYADYVCEVSSDQTIDYWRPAIPELFELPYFMARAQAIGQCVLEWEVAPLFSPG
ncbi:MAG: hypothetical protein AAFQ65_07515 [Myxococcota bacterium]